MLCACAAVLRSVLQPANGILKVLLCAHAVQRAPTKSIQRVRLSRARYDGGAEPSESQERITHQAVALKVRLAKIAAGAHVVSLSGNQQPLGSLCGITGDARSGFIKQIGIVLCLQAACHGGCNDQRGTLLLVRLHARACKMQLAKAIFGVRVAKAGSLCVPSGGSAQILRKAYTLLVAERKSVACAGVSGVSSTLQKRNCCCNVLVAASAVKVAARKVILSVCAAFLGSKRVPFYRLGKVFVHAVPKFVKAAQRVLRIRHATLGGAVQVGGCKGKIARNASSLNQTERVLIGSVSNFRVCCLLEMLCSKRIVLRTALAVAAQRAYIVLRRGKSQRVCILKVPVRLGCVVCRSDSVKIAKSQTQGGESEPLLGRCLQQLYGTCGIGLRARALQQANCCVVLSALFSQGCGRFQQAEASRCILLRARALQRAKTQRDQSTRVLLFCGKREPMHRLLIRVR